MARACGRRCGSCFVPASRASASSRPCWSGTAIFRRSMCCWTKRGSPTRYWGRMKPPLALPELQAAFAGYLLGAERGDLAAGIVPGAISAAGRLAIYRNHVRISLTGALAATYPVVQRLVGEAFFAGAARTYVVQQPPA